MMKTLLFVFAALISFNTYSISQTTGGGQTPQQPAPAPQNQQPSDYPDYIVSPKEDLNPYGMSSIGESTTGSEFREGAGTLGTTQKRPSNLDVNKQNQEKRKEQKETTADQTGEKATPETEIDYEAAYPSEKYTDVKSGPVKTKIYKWTDDQGVKHVTNDLGSVPPQYMDQVKEQLEKE